MIKGQVISGEFGKILVRQKSGQKIELGELLVADVEDGKILMQTYGLLFGSQLSQQNMELIAGMSLEDGTNLDFMDQNLRLYNLALLKSLITISSKEARSSKILPGIFSDVREVKSSDLEFLAMPKHPLLVGKLRSGSKVLDVDIFLDGQKALSHHVLIAATTGRGKSNLTSSMLWSILENDYAGILVLDPHDEYYGRNGNGLKDHINKHKVGYYTPNPPVGARSLKINLKLLRPWHFNGVVDLSDPQKQALTAYFREYGDAWIEAIILEKPLKVRFEIATTAIIKRIILPLLDLEFDGMQLYSNGIFDLQSGLSTIKDICNDLEQGKVIIIDTSNFSGSAEILIGSLVATEVFTRYKNYKIKGQLHDKPIISVILEEAPRVLGKDALEKGPNIFSTIAREGRKFNVGITAITQLPSLIPREILANINTKIILGIEMQPERQAIIDSAAQDLSEDSRTIASLDVGEALITSNFTKFATPVRIPKFEDLVNSRKKDNVKPGFDGIKVG